MIMFLILVAQSAILVHALEKWAMRAVTVELHFLTPATGAELHELLGLNEDIED
jgi:hypothetical protein